jgi:pimeloyl-ACP methyl ester carboxylesterase
MKLKNQYGENLDLIVEGNQSSDTTVIFIHGLGMDKNEEGLFVDISKHLERYRIIRFDLSGYGNSEGKQEDANFNKHAKDLETIISYANSEFKGKIYLVAHSMGTFVVMILSPNGITKTCFLCIPSSDTSRSIEATKRRILSRPSGVVNENGISTYPRTNGQIQKLGPTFWKALRDFNPIEAIKPYSLKTDLMAFGALQDEVIDKETTTAYKQMQGLKYVELNGDHNFTNPEDRINLVFEISKFLG